MVLDSSARGEQTEVFRSRLGKLVVGQEEALDAISAAYQTELAKLSRPDRPVGIFLFLGPTGTGKTRTVEATAEILVGNPKAVVKIDCAEFQHGHEVAKLTGSPPGYLGHESTPSLLTQEILDKQHTDSVKISFVLFDEVEKAHSSLWNLLLGILDKGTMTLGNNKRVNFSRSMVFMTSNVGAQDMQDVLTPRFGLNQSTTEKSKVDGVCLNAARRVFPPEFLNRVDKIVVFRALTKEQLGRILDLEIEALQKRIFASGNPFVLHLTKNAEEFLLAAGMNPKYGARPLKREIERLLVGPIAGLLITQQVKKGDYVTVDCKDGKMIFKKE